MEKGVISAAIISNAWTCMSIVFPFCITVQYLKYFRLGWLEQLKVGVKYLVTVNLGGWVPS